MVKIKVFELNSPIFGPIPRLSDLKFTYTHPPTPKPTPTYKQTHKTHT
jgi:hypothetical protein